MLPLAALVDDSRVESRVGDRVGSRVAGNTRPRVSGSTHPAGRRSRPGRMARCRRSSVAPVTTWAPVRVGCSVFLNNRYQDPVTGVFLSVDPLVGKTGEPYLYGGGNPTTLSDPNGLCPTYSPTQGVIDDGRGKCQGTSHATPKPKASSGKVASRAQSDNMLVFITAEMVMNREDRAVQLAKPSGCDLLCMLSGVQGVPGQVAASSPDPATVIAVGLDKFRAGAVWDHKPHIAKYTGNAEWLMLDDKRAVRSDTLSNIHYGFVFAEMQVSESIAQFAANGGEVWEPLAAITGTNDDVDRLAISIGYSMHSMVPSDPETAIRVYNDAIRGLLLENFEILVNLGGACYIAECS